MRHIVLDTETTGLSPEAGHRIVEIGCLELMGYVATGKEFHRYVNPGREVPAEALAIHGLNGEFLSRHPRFGEVAEAFLAFLEDSPLVIHNAEFDVRFINAELESLGRAPIPLARAIDTAEMARSRYPGAPANLDALCRRFGIDTSGRALHGALKDAKLLAQVYLELVGGRQPGLELAAGNGEAAAAPGARRSRRPRAHAPTAEEEAAHARFIERLREPIWRA